MCGLESKVNSRIVRLEEQHENCICKCHIVYGKQILDALLQDTIFKLYFDWHNTGVYFLFSATHKRLTRTTSH